MANQLLLIKYDKNYIRVSPAIRLLPVTCNTKEKMNELPQNLKYNFGRELIDQFLLERQLEELSNYYSDYINEIKDISELDESYNDDASLRYMTCQHLAAFHVPFETDEHFLGYNMRLVKREKIFEILSIKEKFIADCRKATKLSIMEIVQTQLNTKLDYYGIAAHYFIGSRYEVSFEIEISYNKNQLTVIDSFVGDKSNRDNNRSEIYKNFKEINL